jgi:hypothetical protein
MELENGAWLAIPTLVAPRGWGKQAEGLEMSRFLIFTQQLR